MLYQVTMLPRRSGPRSGKRDNIPRFNQLFAKDKKITDPLITLDYVYAGTFVDFAITRYGYPALVQFIKSSNFTRSFGKSEQEILKDWVAFLKQTLV
jgi:hypothetical protein